MPPSLRILTLVYPGSSADPPGLDHPWRRFETLNRILRRHLPAATAAVFARPEMTRDGSGAVTWTSTLTGQPTALTDLPDARQAEARRTLADHLTAIARLADELNRRDPDDPEPARLLQRAITYPGDAAVYVVEGAPVLVSWGGTDPGRPLGAAPYGVDPGVDPGPTAPRRRRWIAAALGLLALAAIGLGTWSWQRGHTESALRADLAAALANQCEPMAPLLELAGRIERSDRRDTDFVDIRMAVATEIGICEEAALFGARLDARPPCAHLPALAEQIAVYDLGREPFRSIGLELDRRAADCARVAGLADRLESVAGDCEAVADLVAEAARLDEPGPELATLRLGLDRSRAACELAATLAPRVTGALEDCAALRRLARDAAADLIDLDPDRPPLRELRATLDTALARCDLADHLESELARAQDDCLALNGLHELLQRHDPARAPLDALSARLAIALSQCADLSALEQRFAEANGDCTRLDALAEGLATYRDNLRFLDIQARLAPELAVCKEADGLVAQVAALDGDCARAQALAKDLAGRGDPRFAGAREALEQPLADCARLERYGRRLADAGTDCGRLLALERDLGRETSPSLKPTRRDLSRRLGPCRPPPPRPVIATVAAPDRPAATRPTPPTPDAPPIPQTSGSFALQGDCTGRLTIDPTSGWDGDRVRHIVSIDPPASARVARVTSTNPGCRNCALRKIGPTTWRGDLFYGCGGRGIVQVSYAAYDATGRVICRGNGSDLCLGRRRR